MTTEEFLNLFPGSHAFQTFDDNEQKRKELARLGFKDFEVLESRLRKFNERGAGVFFVVNETDGKGRKSSNIVRVRAVFVDLDGPEARTNLSKVLESHLPPSVVVESSPAKFHCYWLVSDCPLEKFAAVQTALAIKFGGDRAVHDLPRVMRLPGFYHCKDMANKFLTRVVHDAIPVEEEGKVFSLEEIVSGLDIDLSPDSKTTNSVPAADRSLRSLKGLPKGQRNKELFRYASSLRSKGLGSEEIASLLIVRANACEPPLTAAEVETLLKQVLKYKPGNSIPACIQSGEGGGGSGGDSAVSFVTTSDLSNAERLIKLASGEIKYSHSRGWLSWTGSTWRNDKGDGIIERAKKISQVIIAEARKVSAECEDSEDDSRDSAKAKALYLYKWAATSEASARIRAMVELAKSDGRIVVDDRKFDADPWALNCANGVLNLRNGKLSPSSPEFFCSKVSPAEYGKALEPSSLWLRFLEEATGGNKELENYLQRVAGYCLTGSISEKCFFFCYGGGDNGKTVYIETIQALLGDYSAALSSNALIKHRFSGGGIPNDIARLCGARLATVSETPKGERWNDALIKDLTGGDVISARFLNQEFFDFRPQCKLLIRGNNKPDVKDQSAGMWKRIQLIPFETTVSPDKMDRELREKITRRELSGVLMWALEGCLEWQRVGLCPPVVVTQAVKDYKEETDTIGTFLDETVERVANEGAQISASELYDYYKTWCENGGVFSINQTAFGIEMRQKGFNKVKNRNGIHYSHLRFKEGDKNDDLIDDFDA